jgi:MGT family glycosyltransferase
MSRIGVISPPVPGHMNPFLALARELRERGHETIFFHMPDVEAKTRAEGAGFHEIGASDHPLGSLPRSLERLGQLKGLSALRFTVEAVQKTTEMVCRDAPRAIEAERIEMLLVDQTEPAGGVVAEHLNIPFVTICNALALNRDDRIPPAFSPWAYREGALARIRNRIGYASSNLVTWPVERTLRRYRRRWKLPPFSKPDDYFSRLAQISQLPPAFDFPERLLPDCFHYTGPFRKSGTEVDFPWDRLDGRPLIYASLGSLQGANEAIFRCFGEACKDLGVQLVITHGERLTKAEAQGLERFALVVGLAPQLAVLSRASLTITHAGLNTVLDSLTYGLPLLALPITFEQPGIAERIAWTRCGRILPLRNLSASRVRSELEILLEDSSYRENAKRIAASIAASGGVRRAADVVEDAMRSARRERRQPAAAQGVRGTVIER